MSDKYIDHEYTTEIVCPYCGCNYANSCEFPDEGIHFCEECENEFEYVRDIQVTYDTYKIKENENENTSDRK